MFPSALRANKKGESRRAPPDRMLWLGGSCPVLWCCASRWELDGGFGFPNLWSHKDVRPQMRWRPPNGQTLKDEKTHLQIWQSFPVPDSPTLWERWVKASAYIVQGGICAAQISRCRCAASRSVPSFLAVPVSPSFASWHLMTHGLDKRSKWPVKTRDLKLAKRLNWRMICRCIVYINIYMIDRKKKKMYDTARINN